MLSRSRSVTPQEAGGDAPGDGAGLRAPPYVNHIASPRPPKILESPMDSKSLLSGELMMIV